MPKFNPDAPSSEDTKVLVADDRPKAARTLAQFLSREGYRVIVAHDGPEALHKVDRERPDLILLDVTMPEMNGYDVCRRIKSDPATLFLPVILTAAREDREERVKGMRVGADDFISKPADRDELLARVKSLTRVKALHDALEASNERLRNLAQERKEKLEQATRELQEALERRAPSSANVIASSKSVLDEALQGWEPACESPLARAAAEAGIAPETMRDVKHRLLSRLTSSLEGRTDLDRTPEVIDMLNQRLADICKASDLSLPERVRRALFRDVVNEIVGYGPIEPLLADSSVTEVMVNGPNLVYVERDGKLVKTALKFEDDDHVLRVINRIVRPLGRRVNRRSPAVDARLPDGSRVNAIIPPCAIDGPSITVRKFAEDKLMIDDLIGFDSITAEMAEFLEACVGARLNIVVSGGTGSGKTTLLNILSSFISGRQRIVTIEDSAELQLHQEHVVRLESQPADPDGSGEMTIRDLVRNSLRMRPDRIVVGEVRGAEALDMLQAMNTGHDGSLTTVHANSPRDSIARLETLVLMAGMDLPIKAIRAQIASAIDLIVQVARLNDGTRKVVKITEVQGMEADVVVLSDIFAFREEGIVDDRVIGELKPTGIRPKFTPRLEAAGYNLRAGIFVPTPRQPDSGNGRRR
jgi:pilus assembly protein CpaF